MTAEVVSVVMPAFNAATTIEQSIRSIQAQTFEDWVLYVIDDASPDGTGDIVEAMGRHDARIRYLRLGINSGVAAARNEGIRRASGRYIAFLDSDDLWHPDKLATQLAVLANGETLVATNYFRFRGDPALGVTLARRKPVFTRFDMLQQNQIGNLTGIYDQRALGKVFQRPGGHEDYLMWIELVRRAGRGVCIQAPLAYYRVAAASLSGNKARAASWQWQVYRSDLKMGLLPSTGFYAAYVIRAVFARL